MSGNMRFARLGLMTLAVVAAAMAGTARADWPEGKWKLVVLAFGDDEFAIFDVKAEGENLSAKVVDAQQFMGGPEVESIEMKDGILTGRLKTASGPASFTGKAPANEREVPVLGAFEFRGQAYPARLEATTSDKVGQISSGEIVGKLIPLRQIADETERFAKLKALIEENPKSPTNSVVYTYLLEAAEGAAVPEAEVRGLANRWVETLEPYGQAVVDDARMKALSAIAGKKTYADFGLELAKLADTRLGEGASVEQRAKAVGMLASAAELAGNDLLAKSAKERAVKLEGELDAEYLSKVPPFKPAKFEGRAEKANDRVVLMELFTGAQCPPCVAADVGFDGLLETYEPTEFIGLQYHLHIPGPDPLTNQASLDRSKYYDVRSTPTTVFNGEAFGRGGGPMAFSEGKYNEFRTFINEKLEAKSKAWIDLKVERDGSVLSIKASAKADEQEKTEPKLRLVLIEEMVRYVGGNALRFHHHVVRDMPGGADGKALEGGKVDQEVTVNLNDLRIQTESYLSDYAKNRAFPGVMPSLDMKKLSVVAFVQDDTDKSVWHATVVHLDHDAAE